MTEEEKAAAAKAAAEKKQAAEAAKAEKARVAAEAKAAKDAEKAAAAKAKADAAAAAKAEKDRLAAEAKAAKAAAAKMPEQNGVRRPTPEGKCGKAWAIFDALSAAKGGPVSIAEALVEAKRQTDSGEFVHNESNVKAEYARWRKFFGVTGRIDDPNKAAEKQRKLDEAKAAKDAKAKELADKKAAAAAEKQRKADEAKAKREADAKAKADAAAAALAAKNAAAQTAPAA
jgi:colicin import membrane protein